MLVERRRRKLFLWVVELFEKIPVAVKERFFEETICEFDNLEKMRLMIDCLPLGCMLP